MPRTSLVLGIVVTIMAGSLVDFGGRRQPHASHLMLIYVGADDCAPCRLWQRDVATSFRATPTFRQITYREVKSPTLFDILNDAYWPDDLRDYRAQLGRGAGVPMWMIVADRKVVGRGYGASQWHSAILPTLEALVR